MRIDDESIFYAFHSELIPVVTVESGAEIQMVTRDCFSNQISTPEDFSGLDWNQVNPATGPVALRGAQPGDILKVEVLGIKIADSGIVCVVPGAGVLGDRIEAAQVRILSVDDRVRFNEKISLPLNKMIGVIGVAPRGEAVPNGVPGDHGGNMDNRVIREGATLYLPVFHEGALFGAGDVHGAMGDGEIGVSGLEVAAELTFRLSVIPGSASTIPPLEHPLLEDDQDFYAIVSGETLDSATKRAVATMADLVQHKTGLSLAESTMLMSLAGHTEIAQVVDPQVTVRYRLPKQAVAEYFTSLF
ncbi:amidase [Alkalispirochaeta americana]|uniref:Amidase n=1 Tax=Alkalispirochaeta americana TaxID=159291 RepID=A0A1N6QWG6_9SPIO|nr:acetamidase/formamidase family protein [Alkalispirochaeta americana]SIQ20933.1 amidase [Alkalispirochaeta americana]